ncbi:unnamed protein product [Didymodactylos carnosus]|uniref:EF-hand domain-containing protein n=1 Tax=Didymodactylos carnosus TaxID=1234261 RepID=A0A815X257_9BILA|nr:unnamed protein product [Didymodactylos carnosus]CAF1549603.1 unnamed protein product [Didymodactylos carnosus]CAF3984974.1 unnamed protein product [Didymodactylos carnosus]CAF4410533.1 unnamed protein product [Didymodactylos carnosus]
MITTNDSLEVFKTFDKNNDGFISRSELRTVMKSVYGEKVTREELDDMIRVADLDKDGKINYEAVVFITFYLGQYLL